MGDHGEQAGGRTIARGGSIFDWMLSRYGGRYPRVLLVVLLRAQHLVLIVSLGVLALYLPRRPATRRWPAALLPSHLLRIRVVSFCR